jgi:hypothetical protein
MYNFKTRLERLEKMQSTVAAKIDCLDRIPLRENAIDDTLKSKNKFVDLNTILNDDFNDLTYLPEKILLPPKKIKLKEKKVENKIQTKISNFFELKVDIVEMFEINKEDKFIDPKNNTTEKVKLSYVAPITKENKISYFEKNLSPCKVEDDHLTNELFDLKLKMNQMREKNTILKNLLKNDQSIKSSEFLEKIIIGFIENLAVNWNELVNIIIDDIIEEEIFILNDLELQKIRINEVKNPTVIITKQIKSEEMLKYKESLLEINELIQSYKNEENFIYNKYN